MNVFSLGRLISHSNFFMTRNWPIFTFFEVKVVYAPHLVVLRSTKSDQDLIDAQLVIVALANEADSRPSSGLRKNLRHYLWQRPVFSVGLRCSEDICFFFAGLSQVALQEPLRISLCGLIACRVLPDEGQ